MCCSAAYAIASQCDSIITASEGEGIGSIGIVVDCCIDDSYVSITSSNAPNKRPDVATEEGVNQIRKELDAYEELFIEAIASGRSTTTEEVIKKYGQGSVTTARNALKYGMIDSIASKITSNELESSLSQTALADAGRNKKPAESEGIMNKEELQAKHPEIYAEIKAEGFKEGKTKEQERVSAFAEIGEASGAMELAMACIKDGTEHSAAVNTKFIAAQMKKQSLANLCEDNIDTSNVNPNAPVNAKSEQEKLDDETIAAFSGKQMETF